MARKTTSSKKSPEPDLRESAQKIWLAGLGALSVAEEEGSKLFESLVDQGNRYQDSVRDDLGRARSSVETAIRDVRSRTGKTIERVESAFDDQVSSALNRIGVPRVDELARLSKRVEELNRKLDKLKPGRKSAATGAAAAPKKAVKKATRKATKKKITKKKTTARKVTRTSAAGNKKTKPRATSTPKRS